MKNPEFDHRFLRQSDLALLREVAAGNKQMRNGIPRLLRAKMVRPTGLYGVEVSPRGQWALAGIFEGTRFIITERYKLPHMTGRFGVVLDVFEAQLDGDGYDEFGYVVHRSTPIAHVYAKVEGFSYSEWCFQHPSEIEPVMPTNQPEAGFYGSFLRPPGRGFRDE